MCLDVVVEGTRERLGVERDEHLLSLLRDERFERLPIEGESDATLFALPVCAHEVENEVGPFVLQGLLNARARHRHAKGCLDPVGEACLCAHFIHTHPPSVGAL